MKRLTAQRCPVTGCTGTHERWETVCLVCWRRLPFDLRNAIETARKAQSFARAAAARVAAVQWLYDHPIGASIVRVTGEAGAAPP